MDRRAESLNLKRGMGMADARAMQPGIDVVDADTEADLRMLEALADWCDRYTPLVALDGVDGLFLDISGCSHLFGGEEALLSEMLRRFNEQGFDARAAIAGTAGTAWAVARSQGRAIVTDGDEADWLAPLPLAALRLDTEVCAALEAVGLRTVGAVMAVPRAPVTRRFGKALLLRLDQALGRIDEALSPRMPVPELSAERRLAEPVTDVEEVERVILPLAGSLKEALERLGAGALTLHLLLFRVDGGVIRLSLGLSRPTRDPERIGKLFHERLAALGESLDMGYGFDLIRLSALSLGPLVPKQTGLADDGDDNEANLALFIDRVGARFGRGVICKPIPVASHLPERAVALFPTAEAPDLTPQEIVRALQADRPLRLLRRPEPVEVMAEVPEGPPVRFRWRRAHYRITRSEGPERIEPEWWLTSDGKAKDYFCAEDSDGRRYWLYREGLYGNAGAAPRWFLHGVFA
ncbi:Y-family DNA polymerase [Mesorhizobium sp. Root157]|uniref:Y-family DNA polymerase n=1 Tax=Mesorhizobium sp. Root157 TaxID=1736477 RepID=UPI001FCCE5D3|nr:DNA polymerase Y family protein [Mesorhizobium sp. Root157]